MVEETDTTPQEVKDVAQRFVRNARARHRRRAIRIATARGLKEFDPNKVLPPGPWLSNKRGEESYKTQVEGVGGRTHAARQRLAGRPLAELRQLEQRGIDITGFRPCVAQLLQKWTGQPVELHDDTSHSGEIPDQESYAFVIPDKPWLSNLPRST